MNDMKKWCTKIENIAINSHYTIEEIKGSGLFKMYQEGSELIRAVSAPNIINIWGGCFFITLLFQKEVIKKAILNPILKGYPMPDYPDDTYQCIKRELCDQWLRNNFGEPNKKNKEQTFYTFDWGIVNAVSAMKGKGSGTEGYIVINYDVIDD